MSVRTLTFLHTCHFRTQVRGASVAMRLKLAQADTLFDTQEPQRLQIRELCSLCTHPLVVMLPCCVSPRRLHPSGLERMLKTSLCSASSVLCVRLTSFRLNSHRFHMGTGLQLRSGKEVWKHARRFGLSVRRSRGSDSSFFIPWIHDMTDANAIGIP